jgi:hypothetical protein
MTEFYCRNEKILPCTESILATRKLTKTNYQKKLKTWKRTLIKWDP